MRRVHPETLVTATSRRHTLCVIKVALSPLDEPALARLLDAAMLGADPLEVMPPADGPPGWTPDMGAALTTNEDR